MTESASGNLLIKLGLMDDPRNRAITSRLKAGLGDVKRAALYIGGALAPTVYEAKKVQEAQAKTNTIFRGSRYEMEALHDKVRELSVEFGRSNALLEEGLYQTGSSGVKQMSDALQVMRASTLAAIGGQADQARVVDIVTSVMRGYNREAAQAVDITDALFVAVDEGKTTMEQMSANMGRAVKMASNLKIPFEEILAMTATLTQTGGMESTPEVVTEIVATMNSLLQPTTEATQAARRLGIEFSAETVRARGLAYVLAQVREKTGDNVAMQAKLFPNVRALRGVLGLVGEQAGEFNRILAEMENRTGRTSEKFAIMAGTDAHKLDQALNAVRVAGEGIGDQVMVKIAEGIDALGGAPAIVERIGFAFELVKQVGVEVVSTFEVLIGSVGKIAESYFDMKYALGGNLEDAHKANEWKKWSEGFYTSALQRGSLVATGAAKGASMGLAFFNDPRRLGIDAPGAGVSEADRRTQARADRWARMGEVGLYNRRGRLMEHAYDAAGDMRRHETQQNVNFNFQINGTDRREMHRQLDRRLDEAETSGRRGARRQADSRAAALAIGG